VNANATALRDVIGASSASAKKYAGQWISFDAKNQQYGELVAGLLNSQVSDELKMNAPFHYGKTKTINGKSAIAVVGTVTDDSGKSLPSTLYVAASGTPLPVEQSTGPTKSGTLTGTVLFTNWGQNIKQKTPAHAVPVAKLSTVSTSGTTTTTTKG
jgi:hypothetical protein